MKRLLILQSVFFTSCILVAWFFFQSDERKTPPCATYGDIDLRSWNFESDGPIRLDGEWMFQDSLVNHPPSRMFENTTVSIQVPGYWNNVVIGGRKMGSVGIGTYRIRILVNPRIKGLAVWMKDVGTAYSMAVNGVKSCSAGTIGNNAETSKPQFKAQICSFPPSENGEYTVEIQVSNFHDPHGGLWEGVTLGYEDDLRISRNYQLYLEFLIFGAILFMAVYHIVLYVSIPRDISPLFFSIVCILTCVRILFMRERFILTLFPGFEWNVFFKMEFLTYSLTVGVFFSFFRIIFPDEFNRTILRIVVAVSCLYSIIVILTPSLVYASLLRYFQIFTVMAALYALYVNIRAVINMRVGATAILVGAQILFATVINDILHQNQIVHTAYVAPIGLFILLFSQATTLSIRYSRAFKSVEELERKYRNIFENAIEGIYQQTYDGKFINVNPSLAGILGYNSPHELMVSVNNVMEDLVVDEGIRNEIRNIFKVKGELLNYEVRLFKKTRTPIWVLLNVKAVLDKKEHISHFEGMILDITERKRSEDEIKKAKDAAEAANTAKTQFIANMSHELRTPLNGVIGMTEMLNETPLNEDQIECLRIIKSSSSLLLTIVNDILDLSKIETGQFYIDNANFNIKDVLDDVHSILRERAAEKKIEFDMLIPAGICLDVCGDEERLKQVLLNIAGNAIKFTDKGFVRIQLEPRTETNSVNEVMFHIRDSGIGIDRDKIELLFRYFSQVDASMSRKYGGTGLGLAISKHLVELMGGRIGVNSELEKGSDFWFTIPFEIPAGKCLGLIRGSEESQTDLMAEEGNSTARVLIVEDNPVNRKLAETMLKKMGHDSDSVADGSEAMEILKSRKYDVILMDIQMPVLDGFETTRKIRDKKSDVLIHDVPIIAMTAHAMKGDMEKCLAAGMDAYLTKPIQPQKLKEAIGFQLRHVQKTMDVPS